MFLHFTNISTKDSGLYRCKMWGNVSLVSHSINVSVLECPTEISVPEKRSWDAQVSSSLTLNCTVRYGYQPRPAVTWCRQQGESCMQLETGEKRNVSWHQLAPNTGVCLLTFLSVSLSDSGEYRCKVYQRKACGDTIFSPSLQLYVTKKGQVVTEHCIKAELGVLAKVMDIGRIFFFIAVTVAVILLTLCWALKLKGKLFPRDRPPTHSPASQELLEVPPPPRCQQSGMEMPDDDPSADSEPSDYETCI
ncbi:B- and T-lymphocyte attenuator-like [Anguilla anguilla]|uniref:B- and T-lymphocyte attenuator-like n=1 Tax=Anguilla anguilla TaxID=7936 RepID=UPI0015AD28EB|nr:B- and T-lymphocyte attenuator-like [Anguilla anguilla]